MQSVFWPFSSSVSSVETCHSTMNGQSILPTAALPQYICMQITCLGFSFAYEWKKDKGMLKFQKRLNGGVTATTGLLNLICEIVSCCDDLL